MNKGQGGEGTMTMMGQPPPPQGHDEQGVGGGWER